MNLRLGLFRLWIVGSALFVLAVALVSYSDIKEEFDDAASATLNPVVEQNEIIADPWAKFRKPVTDPALLKRLERTPSPWATLGAWAAIAFGIPLMVLALGSSLLWALSGFAATRK
jgi:hypothetical protein